LSDKLAVRDYIAAHVGANVLPELLWVGDDPDAIPLATLDPPYIVKPTHAAGLWLKVYRPDDVDIAVARPLFSQWLKADYGSQCSEPGYAPVPRRLIVERLLLGSDGNPPVERRFFVFNGQVRLIMTSGVNAWFGACHDQHWKELPWHRSMPRQPGLFPRPKHLETLVEHAECLGSEVDHVRIDVYDLGDRFYIGELTLYSWSGFGRFNPDEADLILGSYWTIERAARRAIMTTLTRRHEIDKAEVKKLRQKFASAAASLDAPLNHQRYEAQVSYVM
jgi:hypothetical protein